MAYAKGKAGKKQKKIDTLAKKRDKKKAAGKSTKIIQGRINRRIKKQKKVAAKAVVKKKATPKKVVKKVVKKKPVKKSGYFSKASRTKRKTARNVKRNAKKINKRAMKLEKGKKGAGLNYVKLGKKTNPAKISATGKIRKKSTSVKLTEGGAYPTYKKKSKAAGSFKKAFAAAKGKNFTWDGRKYSGKKK